jgi:hypothetical protein
VVGWLGEEGKGGRTYILVAVLLLARNFEGRRHFAAEVVVKRGSFKYLKIFFF